MRVEPIILGTPKKKDKGVLLSNSMKKKILKTVPYLAMGVMMFLNTYCPAYAAGSGNAVKSIKDILSQFINIICMVFSGVGIVMAAYCVGKGIMAFRNDDIDGQQRAAQGLIVSIVLIAIGPIINGLDLVDKLYTY